MGLQQWAKNKQRNLDRLQAAIENNSKHEQLWHEHPAVPEYLQEHRIKADSAARRLQDGYRAA